MATPYLGEIKMVAFNFAATGWAFTNGQTLAIAQNTALFTLVGTTYGGDGQNTSALPDLRSRMPMHMGQAVGLSSRLIGRERWRGDGHASLGANSDVAGRSHPGAGSAVLAGRNSFAVPGHQLHHRPGRHLSDAELKTRKTAAEVAATPPKPARNSRIGEGCMCCPSCAMTGEADG